MASSSEIPVTPSHGTPRHDAGSSRPRFDDLAKPGFALIVTALVAGAIIAYWNTLRLVENDRRVTHTHMVIMQAGELLSTLKDAETGQRGYLLVGDPSYLDPYQVALRRERGVMRTLHELTLDDAAQRARVEALMPLVEQRTGELSRTIALAESGDRAAALNVVRSGVGRSTMDRIRVEVAAIQRAEDARLVQRSRESEESAGAAMTSILIAGLLGVALVILVFILNERVLRLRKADAETIAQQRNQLRVTLASIDDAVITTDTAGRVTSLNEAAEALTGWSENEAIGRPLDVVYNLDYPDPARRRHRHGAELGHDTNGMLISREGTKRPVEDSASPIRDTEGRTLGVVLAFRDISARREAERALRESRAQLEEELSDMKLLQSVSAELIGEKNVEALYHRIIDAAVGIMRSDYASMQILEPLPEPRSLRLLAHRGFAPESAQLWQKVRAESECTCGVAFANQRREVVPDLERCEYIKGTEHLQAYRHSGIRAVQSTPLVSRSGRIVGMISTHWRQPHQPPARRLVLIDILARQAADLLERHRAEQEILSAQESLEVSAANDAFRIRVADTLRTLSDAVEIQSAGARVLSEYLSCERATYAEVDPSGKDFVITAEYHEPGRQALVGRYPVDVYESAFHAAAPPGRASAVADVQSDPDVTPEQVEAYATLDARSFVAVALTAGGRLLAGFAIHQSTPRVWKPDELALVEDTAERIWTAVERTRAEQALRDADRRKDEFLAILAHELRNPLSPVRNAAQFLKLKTIPDEMRRPIEMIDRQVSQMARLIDDLLDVSRITRGVVPLRLEYVDWAEIVQAVMITCEAEVQVRRHSLRVSLPPQPVTLWADRQRLIQVFSNLVSNAAKYTPAGGRIDFSAQPEHGRLEVVVRDNGIGIPPEKLSEVFELFAQVDRSLERQGGLGIGLTLARQLIELHHGTIEAHSDGVGRGSNFAVRLPIVEAAPLEPVATDGSGSQTAASSRRILVVDDNQDAAESLALLLGMSGHEAKSFTDGHEALEAGSALRPDLAFVDIGMPRMNGYDLARRIRGTRWGRRIFLVALTGWGQEADRLRSHEAGFDAHMVKPPSPEALATVLQAIGVPREQEPAR